MSSRDGSNELYDYLHALRILSNVLSLYLFRVIEYMRGNHYSTKELAEKCAHGFDLTAEMDREHKRLLNQVGSPQE